MVYPINGFFEMHFFEFIHRAEILEITMGKKMTLYSLVCGFAVWGSLLPLTRGITVDMSNQNLQAVPQTIDLTVTNLILRENHFFTLDAYSFKKFSELLELDVVSCRIEVILDGTFAMQNRLETLDMTYNNIHDLPLDFGPLVNSIITLRMYRAFANNYDLKPYYFSAFSRLKDLEVGGLPFTFTKAHIPTGMTKLGAFDYLKTLPDFSNMTHLTTLDVSYNDLIAIPSEYILGLNSLTFIGFGKNRVELMPDLSHLNNLEILSAWSNSISIIPRNTIQGLGKLYDFGFENNKLKTMPNVSYLSSLQYLRLPGNLIRHIPNNTLNGLPNLWNIDLTGNMIWHMDGLQQLAANNLYLFLSGNQFIILPDLFDMTLGELHIRNNPLLCNQSLCWLRMWPWFKDLPSIDNPECAEPQNLAGMNATKVHPVALNCYKGQCV